MTQTALAYLGGGVTFGVVLVLIAAVWIVGQRFIDRGWKE